MGYNLQLACHTCAEQTFALRGEEAKMISLWAKRHPTPHLREARVDNGWSTPDEFPTEYAAIYDELKEVVS